MAGVSGNDCHLAAARGRTMAHTLNLVSMPPTTPLSALWRPTALLTVVLGGEALAAILALAPMQSGARLMQFGLASLAAQWVLLGTLCLLFLLRAPLSRLPALRLAWVCLALFLMMSLLVAEAAWAVLSMTATLEISRSAFVLRLLALALVVGLIGLLTYQNYWRSRQLAVRAKQLELEALQARIRPHFLFNTLNTGAALVHAQPDVAERVLLDLADLFRSALRGPKLIPLHEELELTQRYLDIEALRFGERLRLVWEVPDTLPSVQVPSLSIQPLAENAIRHGIERLPHGGQLQVIVTSTHKGIEVLVSNDLPEEAGDSKGHAVGLASAKERILAMTDGRGRVDTVVEDGRFVAKMVLPKPV